MYPKYQISTIDRFLKDYVAVDMDMWIWKLMTKYNEMENSFKLQF